LLSFDPFSRLGMIVAGNIAHRLQLLYRITDDKRRRLAADHCRWI
jgi:hypothetical protein